MERESTGFFYKLERKSGPEGGREKGGRDDDALQMRRHFWGGGWSPVLPQATESEVLLKTREGNTNLGSAVRGADFGQVDAKSGIELKLVSPRCWSVGRQGVKTTV